MTDVTPDGPSPEPAESHGDGRRCVACFETLDARATRCPHCGSPQRRSRWRFVAVTMAWVGGATAVLSLLFGVLQLRDLVQGYRAQEQALEELQRAARAQIDAGDFAGAAATLRSAGGSTAASSDGGGGVPAELGDLELEATMAELRESHIVGDETFKDLVDRLLPTLRSAVGRTEGQLKADILAHIGWAHFLLLRGGRGGSDTVNAYYEQSLESDPLNVYGNTMAGHFALWPTASSARVPEEERFADAKRHFAAAKSSRRELDWVHGMEASAWLNITSTPYRIEALRFADELRRAGESLPAGYRDRILRYYSSARSERSWREIEPALSTEDHVDTIVWLGGDGDTSMRHSTWTMEVLTRLLRELGDPAKARSVLDTIGNDLDETPRGMLVDAVAALDAGGGGTAAQ